MALSGADNGKAVIVYVTSRDFNLPKTDKVRLQQINRFAAVPLPSVPLPLPLQSHAVHSLLMRGMFAVTNAALYIRRLKHTFASALVAALLPPLAQVWALVDLTGDGKVDYTTLILSGFANPNGVAWRDGNLYIGLPTRIVRLAGIDRYALKKQPFTKPLATVLELPVQDFHQSRYLSFGPDGKLYFGIGKSQGCERRRSDDVE